MMKKSLGLLIAVVAVVTSLGQAIAESPCGTCASACICGAACACPE